MRLLLKNDEEKLIISLYQSGKNPTDTLKTTVTEYQKKIESLGTSLQNSLMPPAVRYYDYTKGIVLFERPPCYAQFNFTGQTQNELKAEGKSKTVLTLPIPWQRYVAWLGPTGLPYKIYIFFASHQINSLDNDPMNFAPLPNLYSDCSLCLPVFDHIDIVQYDLMDAISNIYNIVWKSGFNVDVFHASNHWVNHISSDLNPLAKFSFKNQHLWYSNWSKFSLDQIMKFSWDLYAYPNFNTFIQTANETIDVDYFDKVVDLYLAAK
jgi:hypothetical protein